VAIGSRATHSHVVRPRWRLTSRRLPFATTSYPSGTVTSKAKEAGSSGWSFAGNQNVAASGWPTTSAPSVVVTNPEGKSVPGIVSRSGTPP
jgi:hypothetical protein